MSNAALTIGFAVMAVQGIMVANTHGLFNRPAWFCFLALLPGIGFVPLTIQYLQNRQA